MENALATSIDIPDGVFKFWRLERLYFDV